MNKELLQAAITFFRDQHGTYDAMKAQMLSGGIPAAEIEEIYGEIKRLNLDPSLPGYKASVPPLQSVTATSSPIKPSQEPSAAPQATPPVSATQHPVTPPLPANTTPQAVTPPVVPQTVQAPPQTPIQAQAPAPQTPIAITSPMAPPVATAPVATTAEAAPQSKSKSVVVLIMFLLILTTFGMIGWAIYDGSSMPAKMVQSLSSSLGLGDDVLASLRPNNTPVATPVADPVQSTQLAATSSDTGNITMSASVPTSTPTTPTPVAPANVDPSLTSETRAKDLETLQKIQAQCLTRYGNVQFCFDGNAYVVRKIVQNFDALKIKSFAEKTKSLESLSSKAVSGSDTAIISTTPSGTLVNGRPILISINTLITPATCTDSKSGQTITIPASPSYIQVCNPKPDVLTNISCATYTNIVNICANGIQKNGTYNSNDDPQVQALLKKYTDALFNEDSPTEGVDSTLNPQ